MVKEFLKSTGHKIKRFEKLNEIFTSDWIKNNIRHPIARELLKGSIFFHSLVQLEKNLRLIEKCEKSSRVIKRLKNLQEYFGALFEIEVGAWFTKAGFKIEFQRKFPTGKGCDIYLKENNIFVEVKTLGQSNVEKRVFEIMHHTIENVSYLKNVKVEIRFRAWLAKFLEFINYFYLPTQEVFIDVLKKVTINNLKKKLKNLPVKKEEIDKFAVVSIKRNKKFSLKMFGPEISKEKFNELVAHCIRKASEQLPKGAAGIVVVRTYHIAGKKSIESNLQKILSKYPHIIAVILLQIRFMKKFLYRKYLVKNPFSKFSLPNFLYKRF